MVIYNSVAESQYSCFRTIEGFSNLASVLKENPSIFRINYQWDGKLDQIEDFEFVASAAYACRNIVFVIEEVSLFCNPAYVPRPLAKIISIGRHRDLSLYCTSQTPKQINTLIRSQSSEIISFSQTEPAHIDWCREVMGPDADIISTLKPYECVKWTPNDCIVLDKNFEPLDKRDKSVLASSQNSEREGVPESPPINPQNPASLPDTTINDSFLED